MINILIDFPVFRNNGWSKSKNKTLTFSQILTELKLGSLELESLSGYDYESADTFDRHKTISTSVKRPSVKRLVTFFLKKRGYRAKKSKNKSKNPPPTTN